MTVFCYGKTPVIVKQGFTIVNKSFGRLDNWGRRLRPAFSAGASSPKSLQCAAFSQSWAPRSDEKCEPDPLTPMYRNALRARLAITFTQSGGDVRSEAPKSVDRQRRLSVSATKSADGQRRRDFKRYRYPGPKGPDSDNVYTKRW